MIAEPLAEETRIFKASRIVTMNASLPLATHVAVREGRILGMGGPELLDAFGPVTVDDRFAGDVIVPGFVEGHGHAADGLMWRNPSPAISRARRRMVRTIPDSGASPK